MTEGKVKGALSGVRVLDLTDERGIYGAKVIADLGADVIRPESLTGDPLRRRGPHQEGGADGTSSLWHAFFASNRRFFSLDVNSDTGRSQIGKLVERSDIVLCCEGHFALDAANLTDARKKKPELIVIDVSSFGPDGPWADFIAPDLVAGALGGFNATTGDADTPPLKGFGDLNFMVSGAYVAIAALAALHHARKNGVGQHVDVSVHECIVSCLEHVLMCCWYDEHSPVTVPGLARQGSLHWSRAYTVMDAKKGSIMVTPAPDIEAQIFWLVQEDAFEDLLDEKYSDPENAVETTRRVMEVLQKWVSTKDAEELFLEGQSRHAPYGQVLPIESVGENPQLQARKWWVDYTRKSAGDSNASKAHLKTNCKGPGAPYHFSATPWSIGPYGRPGEDTESILADIGWGDSL
jgi:crotonobetainyl-CoA:carnitine CoA-transferase CaiB-like acyl-CoA transferase